MSDSEDEYGPIDTSWGLQTSTPTSPNEPKGWDSLIDPTIKEGPNGLGAGNLHRKGRNFKPIDEEAILAQRLNKPVPKKSKENGSRNGNKPTKKKINEVKETRKPFQKTDYTLSTIKTPKPSTDESNGASKWLQASLVDEPFWEPKKQVKNDTNIKSITTNVRVNSLDKELGIRRKPKIESVWTTSKKEPEEEIPNWGAVSKDIPAFEDKGWEAADWGNKNNTTDNGRNVNNDNTRGITEWGTTEITNSGWGEVSDQNNWSNNNSNNNIPPSKPSWLNSIPSQETQRRQPTRFSNPSKQRYSENTPIDIPKPINYRSENTIVLNTAPPPPPENKIIVTINVELPNTQKVPVDIRELDDPMELAKEFGKKYDVKAEKVLEALTKLFSSQKEVALRKHEIKLQRRVNHSSTQQRRFYTEDNFYNSSFRRPVAPVSPPTFTRKVYY